jgi:hypothetical protein
MVAKDDKIFDSDNVCTTFYVFVANVSKYFKLNQSLFIEIVFVSYYF